MDLLTIKITSKKVSGNKVEFTTREIASKNVRGNNMHISTSKIISKIVRRNKVDFSTVEITPQLHRKLQQNYKYECEIFRVLLKHVSDHLSVLFQFT